MWKKDSEIDQNALDDASIQSAKLHGKYLELFNKARMKTKLTEHQFTVLKHNKWKYYNGKMSKEEMDSFDWPYDPWNGGTKPMKTEINGYINADSEVNEMSLKLEYQRLVAYTLEEILNNIRWRHSNIKNIIQWRMFISGN